jgi:hypothetical protein
LINGISVTFAQAMIEGRERNRSLLLLKPPKFSGIKAGRI